MINNIDCLAVLEHYNLEKINYCNENIVSVCPFHQDTNPSFSMNRKTGSWYCFGCGESGNLYRFIELMENVPIWKAILLATKWSKGGLSGKRVKEKHAIHEAKVRIYDDDYLKNFRQKHSWMCKEGFTPNTLKEWEIGYCNDRNAISIPVRNKEQQLIGIIFRKLIGEPKYLYMKNFPKGKILFGIHKIQKDIEEIIIVEGSLDVLWLWQWGYRNVVSILGNLASITQLQQLSKFDTINICLDTDKAGLIGTRKIIKFLKNKIGINVVSIPKWKKDIRECNPKEIAQVLKNKIPITKKIKESK